MITNPQFFIGVVEDNKDPSKLNRVRVRIFGKHTEDITLLPTAELPWSVSYTHLTLPTNREV